MRVADDWFFRGRLRTGAPLGESLVMGRFIVESRREDGMWRDAVAEGDIYTYGRASWLPNQTLFGRVAFMGGWGTTIPFQLALGGREEVRSLRDDRYPGGQSLVISVENRIFSGWPNWSVADLGLTLFSDAGRVWAGDVPYGVDSPWRYAVGAGIRLGLPAGTNNVMRIELAFPVNGGGSGSIFRMTIGDRSGLGRRFIKELLTRSDRFEHGTEWFN